MCFAMAREFESFKDAIAAAGFDFEQIRGDRDFRDWAANPEMVLELIREMDSDGFELNYSSVREHDASLCRAATVYFGSWQNALSEAGFDSEEIRLDRDREADKGNIFENICFEVFRVLRPSWQKGQAFDCGTHTAYPDLFDPEDEVWIDFKLRAHGESVAQSISKYQGFAEHLHFIYLFGNRENEPGIDFSSIFDFEGESSEDEVSEKFEEIRMLERYKPPPLHLEKWALKWSKENLIQWINEQKTSDLNERSVLINRNDVRCAARRLFVSWNEALVSADVDHESVRRRRKRISQEELDDFIRIRLDLGDRLNSAFISQKFGGEYNASYRIYGGWRQALRANGIRYRDVGGARRQPARRS